MVGMLERNILVLVLVRMTRMKMNQEPVLWPSLWSQLRLLSLAAWRPYLEPEQSTEAPTRVLMSTRVELPHSSQE